MATAHEAFIVTSGSEAFAFLKDERNCWTCRGWGHTKENCPSSKRSRPLSACISGLQEIQSSQNDRLRSMQTRRVRRPGPSPSRRNNAKPTAQVAEVLYEYEDGGVYTPDGDELVAPTVDPAADAASLSASATTTSPISPPTITPQVNVATRADPTATAAPATAAPQASASASIATDASPTDEVFFSLIDGRMSSSAQRSTP